MIDLSRLLKNHIVLFTASRYVGYAMQFVRGILVARLLGPQLFGIWGFLTLAQQYLSYTSFGLQYAVNVELATGAPDPDKQTRLIGSALSATTLIVSGLALAGLGIQVGGVSLFEKYSFGRYALAVSLIAGLYHLQQLFANVYRVYGKLARIAAGELLSAGLPLLAALAFEGQALIEALLGALILAGVLSLALFVVRPPFKITFTFDRQHWKQLFAVGMPLLVYNVSFYLITVSGRTIISAFYSVETMGYYSLANTITSATLLGLNAVSWVVFPDILSRTRAGLPDDVVASVVRKVNDLYGTSVFLAVFGVILGLPALFSFLPQYRPAGGALSILLLSQAVLSVSFGYNCVAIARKEQLKVAGISLVAALVVTGLSLLAALANLPFVWIAIAVLAGSFIYALWQARLGARTLNQGQLRPGYLAEMLPWGSLVATLLFLVGSLTPYTTLAGVLGLAIFVLANRPKIARLWNLARPVVS